MEQTKNGDNKEGNDGRMMGWMLIVYGKFYKYTNVLTLDEIKRECLAQGLDFRSSARPTTIYGACMAGKRANDFNRTMPFALVGWLVTHSMNGLCDGAMEEDANLIFFSFACKYYNLMNSRQ